MLSDKKKGLLGQGMLFLATLLWGTSFLILKETIKELPMFFVIFIRFIVSGVVLGLIFIKRLKTKLTKPTFLHGVILGLFLALAYITQTFGLEMSTPSRNAFLTSSYCVMCPFFTWMVFKRKPKSYNLISAVACIVGIGLIALSGKNEQGANVLLGDGLTLIAAVCFGFQIIFIEMFRQKNDDPISILFTELITVGILFGVLCVVFEVPVNALNATLKSEHIWKLVYLTFACTVLPQTLQLFGQRYSSPNRAGIILSLEAVFGAAFSVALGGEKLNTPLIVGFVVVFVAILISELKPDFKKIFSFLFKRKNAKGK